jgi:hypothetical protein
MIVLLAALMICFAIQGDEFSMWVAFASGSAGWLLATTVMAIGKAAGKGKT